MKFINSLEWAQKKDQNDPLIRFSEYFYKPKGIYFSGNSLGLQPKQVEKYVLNELESWRNNAVEGHFLGDRSWLGYHNLLNDSLARLVGAKKTEVVAMNQLTVNLQLMLTSFLNPTAARPLVLVEENIFPSDYYALQSQLRLKGFDSASSIIKIKSSGNKLYLTTEDIVLAIEEYKNKACLILLGGVDYLTGSTYDFTSIASVARENEIMFGLDLAHAIGNIPLSLNDWGVDFAVWCSYKYLNSGPGGVGGGYVHEKYHHDFKWDRLTGWWGHQEKSRFKMQLEFEPFNTAEAWQLSNAPILSMAAHRASLDIFDQTSMKNLRAKSIILTGYLEFLIKGLSKNRVRIITPENCTQRGCQLSLQFSNGSEKVIDFLKERNITVDSRRFEDNILVRVAPVPLYNSFEEVYYFGRSLEEGI